MELLTCSICGNRHDKTTDVIVEQQHLCNVCANEYTDTCHHCGDRYFNHNLTHGFCESCHNELFTACTNCGCDIRLDSANYLNDNDAPYCDSCYQNEILGMVSTIIPTAKKHLYFTVSSVIRDKVVILKLFEIQSGIILDAKLWLSQYNIIPIYSNKVVYVSNMIRTNKQEPTGRIIHETGKKEYKIVPDKYEYWVKEYVVQYEEDNIWTTLS